MPFPILDPKQPEPYEALNDNQKKRLVDIYAEGGNATAMKHDKELSTLDHGKYVPRYICDSYIKKIKEVTSLCEQLMQGKIVIEPAEYDHETWEETKAAVYNTIPKTEQELKDEAFHHFPSCTRGAFDYTIEVMISKMTVEWTWEAYKNYFDNLDPNTVG